MCYKIPTLLSEKLAAFLNSVFQRERERLRPTVAATLEHQALNCRLIKAIRIIIIENLLKSP